MLPAAPGSPSNEGSPRPQGPLTRTLRWQALARALHRATHAYQHVSGGYTRDLPTTVLFPLNPPTEPSRDRPPRP